MGLKIPINDYYRIFNQFKTTNEPSVCMQKMILTEDDYRRAIMRFLEICDAEPGTPEHDEALQLTKLMEDYENLSCYERRSMN
ncbi:MAG TPA: hypothetical protein PLG33_08300 [Prolixibacteraceae bacterium]|nr:hypothetical protein [Prolixibacteraceae bacterium]